MSLPSSQLLLASDGSVMRAPRSVGWAGLGPADTPDMGHLDPPASAAGTSPKKRQVRKHAAGVVGGPQG